MFATYQAAGPSELVIEWIACAWQAKRNHR